MCIDNPTKRGSQYGEAVFAVRRSHFRNTVKPQFQYGEAVFAVRRNCNRSTVKPQMRYGGTAAVIPNVGAYRIRPTEEETVIDVSHLAAGLYFLKVDNRVIKVVKE